MVLWRLGLAAAAAVAGMAVGAWNGAHAQTPQRHNMILFVADGLRSQIVTPETAPALAALRSEGVDFQNSHSLYPTVTTVNASAIATGHYIGDTGDFGNVIYVGPQTMGYQGLAATLEDDAVLTAMNQRYNGDYLNET